MMGFSKRKSEPAPAMVHENITLPDAALHVAPTRALTTPKGVLSHCAIIEASDLPGGSERLRELYGAGRVLARDDAIKAFRESEDSMHEDDARECRRNLGIDSPSDHFGGANIPALPAAKQRAKEAQKIVDNYERAHPGIVAELAHPPTAESLAENGSYAWRAVGNAGIILSELGTSVRGAQSELAEARAELARAEQAVTLALSRQTSRYAISPGRTVQLPSGRLARGGEPVRLEDCTHGGPNATPAASFLAWHLEQGSILEKAPEPTEPSEPSEPTGAVA